MARLRVKSGYRPVVFELMPPSFTLFQLQRSVEGIAGRIIPATAGAVAVSGVDLISTGWLAHSAPVLAIGLDHRG